MKPYTNPADRNEFGSRSYKVKLYSGGDALAALPKELSNLGVGRVLILCGRSVHEKTALTKRLAGLLGDRLVGIFPGISEGAPAEAIEEAARIGLEQRADALIAVGAGSVIKGARVVAMLMAEKRPLAQMATYYRDGQLPVSPRLEAAKCPIINVLTAPTTAQNRAGSSLRVKQADAHQLEFFDPKTRPVAIFWDGGALATAPQTLIRSTGLEVWFLSLMAMGSLRNANPLVRASRIQAWELARTALPRADDGSDISARLNLCAAAFLCNRDEDDGGNPSAFHLILRAVYALSIAIFNRCEGLTQSHAYAALLGSAIRNFAQIVPERVAEIGGALGLHPDAADDRLGEKVASATEAALTSLGWATDLRTFNIGSERADEFVALAVRNYNANSDGALTSHQAGLRSILDDALRARA